MALGSYIGGAGRQQSNAVGGQSIGSDAAAAALNNY